MAGFYFLSGEQLNSFYAKRRCMCIQLIAGRAWVSYDRQDVIVESGETLCVPPCKHRVIISPASTRETICYQIA